MDVCHVQTLTYALDVSLNLVMLLCVVVLIWRTMSLMLVCVVVLMLPTILPTSYLVNDVQCCELFGRIALKNHAFSMVFYCMLQY